jgi:hypothetical protein
VIGRRVVVMEERVGKREKKIVRMKRLRTSIPSNMTDLTSPSHRHSEPSIISLLVVKSLTRVPTQSAGEALKDIQLRDRLLAKVGVGTRETGWKERVHMTSELPKCPILSSQAFPLIAHIGEW